MRAILTFPLLLATGISPALAQQISQSPLMAHEAGAACTRGPYPSPSGANNVSGYGIAGCLPDDSREASDRPRLPADPRLPGRR